MDSVHHQFCESVHSSADLLCHAFRVRYQGLWLSFRLNKASTGHAAFVCRLILFDLLGVPTINVMYECSYAGHISLH